MNGLWERIERIATHITRSIRSHNPLTGLCLVAQACRPDAPAGLAAQLHALTQQLAADAGAPAEVRALGRALNAVLAGDRAPDLAGLPADWAEAVRAVIAGI